MYRHLKCLSFCFLSTFSSNHVDDYRFCIKKKQLLNLRLHWWNSDFPAISHSLCKFKPSLDYFRKSNILMILQTCFISIMAAFLYIKSIIPTTSCRSVVLHLYTWNHITAKIVIRPWFMIVVIKQIIWRLNELYYDWHVVITHKFSGVDKVILFWMAYQNSIPLDNRFSVERSCILNCSDDELSI